MFYPLGENSEKIVGFAKLRKRELEIKREETGERKEAEPVIISLTACSVIRASGIRSD